MNVILMCALILLPLAARSRAVVDPATPEGVQLKTRVTDIKVCKYTDYSYEFDIALDLIFANKEILSASIRDPAILTKIRISKDNAHLAAQDFEEDVDMDYPVGLGDSGSKVMKHGGEITQRETIPVLVAADPKYLGQGGFISAGTHVVQLRYLIREGGSGKPPIELLSKPLAVNLPIPASAPSCKY